MTIKQKQCLLCYLGLYSGAIDGIWGPQSAAAEDAFLQQYGKAADTDNLIQAILEENTDWWADIAYFTPAEFTCKCGRYCDGSPAQMDKVLVTTADAVRSHFGAAAIVSSGLRCARHNANVGGVSNSRHLSGKAMDFCIAGKNANDVLAYVQQLPQIRYAYAIDSQYVHMDVD